MTHTSTTEPASAGSYTLDEIAARHRVHRATLYREAKAGRLRLTKIGSSTRVTAEDEAAWLDVCRNRPLLPPRPQQGASADA